MINTSTSDENLCGLKRADFQTTVNGLRHAHLRRAPRGGRGAPASADGGRAHPRRRQALLSAGMEGERT